MTVANYKEKQKKYKHQGFSCKMCNQPFVANVVQIMNSIGAMESRRSFMRCIGGQEAQCGKCSVKYGGLGEQAARERIAKFGH